MWLRSLFAKRERTRFSERGNWRASLCFKPRPVQLDSPETTQTQLRRKSSAEVDSLWGRVPGKLDLAFKANTVSTWLDLPFFSPSPFPHPKCVTHMWSWFYLFVDVCMWFCVHPCGYECMSVQESRGGLTLMLRIIHSHLFSPGQSKPELLRHWLDLLARVLVFRSSEAGIIGWQSYPNREFELLSS